MGKLLMGRLLLGAASAEFHKSSQHNSRASDEPSTIKWKTSSFWSSMVVVKYDLQGDV